MKLIDKKLYELQPNELKILIDKWNKYFGNTGLLITTMTTF